MHKDHLAQELSDIDRQLETIQSLLEKCTHRAGEIFFTHYIRDEISKSLILDIEGIQRTIDRLKREVSHGIENEGEWDGIPF